MLNQLVAQSQAQIEYNTGKNIFCSEATNQLAFSESTQRLLEQGHVLKLSPQLEDKWLAITVEQVLAQLYQTNQFYSFSPGELKELGLLYRKLLDEIKKYSLSPQREKLGLIARMHYQRLKEWLGQSNPFACQFYSPQDAFVTTEVVCAQYSAPKQLTLLGINPLTLQEPILDVGCGKNAQLVTYLAQQGWEVYGIDRSVTPAKRLLKADWLAFEFKPNRWGTIISNQGFSNHFVHHHHRPAGNHLHYARKYMEILQSLKNEGIFYYAPDLPFIEQYLDPTVFSVRYRPVPETPFKAVSIQKILSSFSQLAM